MNKKNFDLGLPVKSIEERFSPESIFPDLEQETYNYNKCFSLEELNEVRNEFYAFIKTKMAKNPSGIKAQELYYILSGINTKVLYSLSSLEQEIKIEEQKQKQFINQKFGVQVGSVVTIKTTGQHGVVESLYPSKKIKLLHKGNEIKNIGNKELQVVGNNPCEFYSAMIGYVFTKEHKNPFKVIEAVNSNPETRDKISLITSDFKMPMEDILKAIKPLVLSCL